MYFVPWEYQIQAARHLAVHPFCALLADPGLGKTAIILALIRGLKRTNPGHRTLIIAGRRVLHEVWPPEIQKWDQFREITFQLLNGDKKDAAADVFSNVYLLTPEGVKWAAGERLLNTFDMLVIDESTLWKNWTSKRMLILKRYLGQFSRRYILTGSPTPENLEDYFSQQFIVDRGATLGHSITEFRRDYFFDAAPMQNFSIWRPRRGALEEVSRLIAPWSYRLDGEELLELPILKFHEIPVPIPDLADYRRRVEEEAKSDGDEGADVGRRGSSYQLARQLAGGFLRDGRTYHTAKLDALAELLSELGRPLLVFFSFREEGDAIRRRFKCPLIYGGVSDAEVRRTVTAWNAGELPLLACNPSTTGHGLNIQDGGNHLAFYSPPISLDQFFQAIRRLKRQGQKAKTVFVHELVSPGTKDVQIYRMLNNKEALQKEFLDEVKRAGNRPLF